MRPKPLEAVLPGVWDRLLGPLHMTLVPDTHKASYKDFKECTMVRSYPYGKAFAPGSEFVAYICKDGNNVRLIEKWGDKKVNGVVLANAQGKLVKMKPPHAPVIRKIMSALAEHIEKGSPATPEEMYGRIAPNLAKEGGAQRYIQNLLDKYSSQAPSVDQAAKKY